MVCVSVCHVGEQKAVAAGLTSIDEMFGINKELYDIKGEQAHRDSQLGRGVVAAGSDVIRRQRRARRPWASLTCL